MVLASQPVIRSFAKWPICLESSKHLVHTTGNTSADDLFD